MCVTEVYIISPQNIVAVLFDDYTDALDINIITHTHKHAHTHTHYALFCIFGRFISGNVPVSVVMGT